MSPRIVLVAAMANNRVIGIDNTLPWHLPEDLKHFKAVTLGKPVIMGRKTFDSIGRPLPGRLNIVITRQADWQHDGVIPLADAMALTHIALDIAGDAHFPAWDAQQWHCQPQPAQAAANGLQYHFADYVRC